MKKDINYLKQLSKETKALKTPLMSMDQIKDLITGKMIYSYVNGKLVEKFKVNDFKGYLNPNYRQITSKNVRGLRGQKALTHLQAKKLAIYGQITINDFGSYYYTTILK